MGPGVNGNAGKIRSTNPPPLHLETLPGGHIFFINNNFKEFRQALSRNDYCKQKPVSKVPSDTKILENPLLKVTCDSSTSEAYKLYPLLVEAKDAEELFVSLIAFKFYS